MVLSVTLRYSATSPMVMMALSAGLDGMVWAKWVVRNTSVGENFQFAIERLKHCAGRHAHRMSPGGLA